MSSVALSFTQLNVLEKKNVDLTDKLSAEQTRHEMRMSKMKESISMLKSSLAKKENELNSSATAMHGLNEAYFRLERKNVDITQSYNKLLVKFDSYHKVVEQSKSESIINVYKLGYLDCKSGVASCHSIEDEEVEMFCLDMPPTQGEQINVVDKEAAEEQMADETAADELVAKEVDVQEGVAGDAALRVE